MEIKRILYFFDKEDFLLFKEDQIIKNKKISSISDYLSKDDIENNYVDDIIDITSLMFSYKVDNLQVNLETLIKHFPPDTIFIADKKHAEIFSFEGRYSFTGFSDLDVLYSKTPSREESLETLKTISSKKRIIDLTKEELLKFWDDFDKKLYGHQKFKDDFKNIVETFRVFNSLGEQKVLSLFLLGDSGVGKTEVARALHKSLKAHKRLAKINFGNYSSKDALNSLIGAPRGYIGSETGELFEKVENTDVGLILIDEFEKADFAVFNYFLEVLETGKMTSSQGQEIDVNGYIFVFTSNISKQSFKENISPELRSRFNYKVHFSLLFNSDKEKFVKYRLGEIINKYEEVNKKKLPEYTFSYILNKISVSNFKNMRELNKRIMDLFVEYTNTQLGEVFGVSAKFATSPA